MKGIDVFVKILSQSTRKEEEFKSLKVRRKLIALKKQVFLNDTPSKKSCTWARKVQCLVRYVLVLQKIAKSEENQEMVKLKETSQISRSSSTFK